MEEIYNKWQLTELELKKIQPIKFTKEELLDFANYYHKQQLILHDVVKSFVCGECGYNKKAVNTTLEKQCCARCRSFVSN